MQGKCHKVTNAFLHGRFLLSFILFLLFIYLFIYYYYFFLGVLYIASLIVCGWMAG